MWQSQRRAPGLKPRPTRRVTVPAGWVTALILGVGVAGGAIASPDGEAAAPPVPAIRPTQERAPAFLSRARFLMGTSLSIDAAGENSEAAVEAAFHEVERLDQVLSNWHESELVRLNEGAALGPVPCSEDLFAAVTVALHWARETDGAFDPTVEPIVRRLGLRGEEGILPGSPSDRRPTAGGGGTQEGRGQPESACDPAPVGWRHVHPDSEARTITFDRPCVGLDLGGIGKGIALDAALRVLRDRGVTAALLNFGGQVLAFGRGPDRGGWEIGLADPADRGRSIGTVSLREGSVATSGQGERARTTNTGRIGHILDPRTGGPAPFEGTVSVMAPNATTADALDTALFVMGRERGLSWAADRGWDVLFQSHDTDGRLVRSGTGSLLRSLEAGRGAVP